MCSLRYPRAILMGHKWRLSYRIGKELGASPMNGQQQSTSLIELIYLLFFFVEVYQKGHPCKGDTGTEEKKKMRFIINLQQKSLGDKLELMIELSPSLRHHYP